MMSPKPLLGLRPRPRLGTTVPYPYTLTIAQTKCMGNDNRCNKYKSVVIFSNCANEHKPINLVGLPEICLRDRY